MSVLTVSWQDVVNAINHEASLAGLSQDQANAAVTVAKQEAGWSGNPGDNATSFGVFQFHFGGQLNNFAAWLGLPILLNGQINPAVIAAANDLDKATQFALQPGGYLHNSLVEGANKGNTGVNLALWAEQFGQGAGLDVNAFGQYFFGPKSIAAVTANYISLFGDLIIPGPKPAPIPGVPPSPNPQPAPSPSPGPIPAKKSADPVFGGLIDALNSIGGALGSFPVAAAQIVLSIERFFWILIGLLLIALGVWILLKSEPQQIEEVKAE